LIKKTNIFLAIHTQNRNQIFTIWVNNLRHFGEIGALVDYIAVLIKEYTGEKPVL